MMSTILLRPARALLALAALTGLVYPLMITGLARVALPWRSGGSLLVVGEVVRGSELVGQDWHAARWFHGRPPANPAAPYDPRPSGGSNLGPTNAQQAERIHARVQALRAEGVEGELPVDLVTASGSGLDPHISPAAAFAQVARVARARALDPARVHSLVVEHVEGRFLGLFGEPRVNVLRLNLSLGALE